MSTATLKRLALFTLALLCGGRATAQTVVNIDFNQSSGTNYSGQGAYTDTGNNFWNSVTSTSGGSGFLASDGTTSTGISISVSGTSGLGTGGHPAFADLLLYDYLYVNGTTPATFTISGLTPGLAYSFYFYDQAGGSGASNRGATFVLNGSSQTMTGNLSGSFVNGTNYLVFNDTPGGTSLSGSFVHNPGSGEAEFNGLQIVAAVPEPSAYAAIGGVVALAGAVIFRRCRRPTLATL